MATQYHDCSGKTWSDIGHNRIYRCSRNATVQRNGKWWCWQHDPERIEANKEKRRARWDAKYDRYTAMWERRERNAKLAQLVTPELASLLDDLSAGCDHSAWLAAERGWAMAARIREALGMLEANDG